MPNFESFETSQDPEEKIEENEQSSTLRKSALVALASLSVCGQVEKAHSSEVEPDMSWNEGLEVLQDEVYRSPVETSVTFVKYKDGTSGWLKNEYVEQTEQNVVYTDKGAKETIKNEILSGKELDKTCTVHTHPLSGAAAIDFIQGENVDEIRARFDTSGERVDLSIPPSFTDVSGIKESRLGWVMSFSNLGVYDKQIEDPDTDDVPTHENMVVDPSGIWYYNHDPEIESVEFQEDRESYNRLLEWTADRTRENFNNLNQEDVQAIQNILETLKDSNEKISEFESEVDALEYAVLNNADNNIADMLFQSPEEKEQYQTYLQNLSIQRQHFTSFTDTVKKYVEASKNENITEDIEQSLHDTYRTMGVDVRFVPHEETASEPACSGVEFEK